MNDADCSEAVLPLLDEAMKAYRKVLAVPAPAPIGFEFCLGNCSTGGTMVIGENPGGDPDEHATPEDCLTHDRAFFAQGGHHQQWESVWKRYAWMLPGNPADEAGFGREASAHLTVANLWHNFGQRRPRGMRGIWTEQLVGRIRPCLVVTQGAKAWDWIQGRTAVLSPGPAGLNLERFWGYAADYTGPHFYRVWWRNVTPHLETLVIPVVHLSGRFDFTRIPRQPLLLERFRKVWEAATGTAQ